VKVQKNCKAHEYYSSSDWVGLPVAKQRAKSTFSGEQGFSRLTHGVKHC